MIAVGPRLKELRERTRPRLSSRAAADKIGIGQSRYAFYENPNTYKKAYLPLDLARQIATVFANHGVAAAEVMMLAGLNEDEAEPEAVAIEAARPAIQFVTLPVALPNEAALADMFESLLALVPAEATRAEAARILAQRLPSGFAAIGPFLPDQGKGPSTATATAPQSPATDHREPAPPSRT